MYTKNEEKEGRGHRLKQGARYREHQVLQTSTLRISNFSLTDFLASLFSVFSFFVFMGPFWLFFLLVDSSSVEILRGEKDSRMQNDTQQSKLSPQVWGPVTLLCYFTPPGHSTLPAHCLHFCCSPKPSIQVPTFPLPRVWEASSNFLMSLLSCVLPLVSGVDTGVP